jgi:threonine/homoserine/homoserine lactone efflux protein
VKLSAPKQLTFWIAVVVAVVGVIASLVSIPVLSGLALWLVVIGFVILAAANVLGGL